MTATQALIEILGPTLTDWLDTDEHRDQAHASYKLIPAEPPRCVECGHPKADHQDADEPVSVGLCTACDEADSDDAHHNYEPEEQQ